MFKKILLGICVVTIIYFVYSYGFIKPSNNKNWEVGFEKLPQIEVNDNVITIKNLRDYKYGPNTFISSGYGIKTVDITKLERVWFLVEPFEGVPLINFGGIAHTYFVFDFKDDKPIAVSVEARREKEEQFGLFSGMLNKFELMYVWGTEEDITQRRILIENNSLYMYPLTISQESGQRLFMQLAKTTQELESEPRFYNTLTSNCTNELAKNANQSKPGTIPYNAAWIFPGFAVNEIYDLQLIPTDAPLEEIKKRYYVSDLVKKHYDKEDFSVQIRNELLQ